ncbi:MAG: pyruvate, phosphate dikinase [Desulfosudaceae bacterium]
MKKYIYTFGGGTAEGGADEKEILGGKGANLAEMTNLGLPVPAGFTISTECCNYYMKNEGGFPESLSEEVADSLGLVEKSMGMKYGDPETPLLVSCRSGARQSMPGMMETVLNVGLTSHTLPGLIRQTGDEWFAYDAYRRLIIMYADVVMEKAEEIEPEEGFEIKSQLEGLMNDRKREKNYEQDTDLTVADLRELCDQFRRKVPEVLGQEFPDNAEEQLWGAIGAVFKSWNGKRAVSYRRIEGIPDEWGTACNVQSMVFGNIGQQSATGVAFTRDPATGENRFYGEWLPAAQGEDVVAGIRTPNPLSDTTKTAQNEHLPSLEAAMPEVYQHLRRVRDTLENHYRDMQDIEFTIQAGHLYMLQTRSGKRTGVAALRMAMDMREEGLIDDKTAVTRLDAGQLDEILHPLVDPEAEKRHKPIAEGLPAGPGGAVGQIVFTPADAVQAKKEGQDVILVRKETSPEDVEGMRAATAILTSQGGMTSHAALVARGWGKCCIVGTEAMTVDVPARQARINGKTYEQGTVFTLNGTRGKIYEGELPLQDATADPRLNEFMEIVDRFRTLGVRANAETPEDVEKARKFGAQGIGLFRTEHMFYGRNAEQPLFFLRKMIMSDSAEERQAALAELYPYMKEDLKKVLELMDGQPVTMRLLDPPLHEFVPQTAENRRQLAEALQIDEKTVEQRSQALAENNPMMGHRGVRLGITYPEIPEAQIRAVFEAAAELAAEGREPRPEIMVPVCSEAAELREMRRLVDRIREETSSRAGGNDIDVGFGTMVETPRAALNADQMAKESDFFSFGTNDLTQLTFGFSRDDMANFRGAYLEKNILSKDPFQTLDTAGVGRLMAEAVDKGRKARPELKIGICGEHGGDPDSVMFCHHQGLDYVSCSPFRLPIARLAAARAAIGRP